MIVVSNSECRLHVNLLLILPQQPLKEGAPPARLRFRARMVHEEVLETADAVERGHRCEEANRAT